MEKEKQMEKPRFTDEDLEALIDRQLYFTKNNSVTKPDAGSLEALLAQLILEIRHQNLSKCCNYPNPIDYLPEDIELDSGFETKIKTMERQYFPKEKC